MLWRLRSIEQSNSKTLNSIYIGEDNHWRIYLMLFGDSHKVDRIERYIIIGDGSHTAILHHDHINYMSGVDLESIIDENKEHMEHLLYGIINEPNI